MAPAAPPHRQVPPAEQPAGAPTTAASGAAHGTAQQWRGSAAQGPRHPNDPSPGLASGVGWSMERNAQDAGRIATCAALESLGGAAPAGLVVFATVGYAQDELLGAVSAACPDVPMAGCSGEGVITRAGSNEGAHCVAVLALGGPGLRCTVAHAKDLRNDSYGAGRALGQQLLDANVEPGGFLMLFPDGLTVNSTALLAGLTETFTVPCTVAGGSAGELMQMLQTYQYRDGQAASDQVSAMYLSGPLRAETVVSHGCEPIGMERTITRAEGNKVFEIDGLRAFDVFHEFVEGDTDDLRAADIVHLCVGEPLPDAYKDEYGTLIVRTPLGFDPESGALSFPAELPTGTTIQLMRRDKDLIRQGGEMKARELAARGLGAQPWAVFQFDCAGRGRIMFGGRTDEHAVTPLQAAFDANVPWIGLNTYGEIAEVGGVAYFHNYTVVLCALYDA